MGGARRTPNADPAAQFVEFMMSDGYLDWLGSAPEGKFPTRSGTPEEPHEVRGRVADAAGGRRPRGCRWPSFYPPAVLDALAGSLDTFRRWGITQGQGALVGATLGELPVPQAIAAMTSGEIDPAEAAQEATATVPSCRTRCDERACERISVTARCALSASAPSERQGTCRSRASPDAGGARSRTLAQRDARSGSCCSRRRC